MSRGQAFFHGTNVGGLSEVLPPSKTGAPSPNTARTWAATKRTMKQSDWASATSRESTAWSFAERAAHIQARGHDQRGNPFSGPGDGRARVFTVSAEHHVVGHENRSHPTYRGSGEPDNAEHLAGSWQVSGSIDIQPPAKEYLPPGAKWSKKNRKPNIYGQQGTLPIDWSPHVPAHYGPNHPRTTHRLEEQDRIDAQAASRTPQAPDPDDRTPGEGQLAIRGLAKYKKRRR